ncbi:hypothetical protein R6Q57_008452 [Mikania cordata]
MENLEHLSFLIYFGEKGLEKIPLGQIASFFANLTLIWQQPQFLQHKFMIGLKKKLILHYYISLRAAAKENGPINTSDHDALMVDDYANIVKLSISPKGFICIEGISKKLYVKKLSKLKTSSVMAVRIEHFERVHVISASKHVCIANCRECVFWG